VIFFVCVFFAPLMQKTDSAAVFLPVRVTAVSLADGDITRIPLCFKWIEQIECIQYLLYNIICDFHFKSSRLQFYCALRDSSL